MLYKAGNNLYFSAKKIGGKKDEVGNEKIISVNWSNTSGSHFILVELENQTFTYFLVENDELVGPDNLSNQMGKILSGKLLKEIVIEYSPKAANPLCVFGFGIVLTRDKQLIEFKDLLSRNGPNVTLLLNGIEHIYGQVRPSTSINPRYFIQSIGGCLYDLPVLSCDDNASNAGQRLDKLHTTEFTFEFTRLSSPTIAESELNRRISDKLIRRLSIPKNELYSNKEQQTSSMVDQ